MRQNPDAAGAQGGSAPVGPVTTVAIYLPDDAAGEVVFARITTGEDCGLPDPPGPAGIIIDDLRAE